MNIKTLKPNQIFVFGSNVNGEHLGGAAKQAYKDFGATWGIGEGISGHSYAFPTLDRKMKPRSILNLKESVKKLYSMCELFNHCEFLLTKVGCGIAGYKEKFMKSLFKNPPNNLILPEDWR